MAGRVDPGAVGKVSGERAALAILDGQNGVPPLVLERAGELAVEKARDAGVGLVRVAHVGRLGRRQPWRPGSPWDRWPASVGPGRSWSMALPSAPAFPSWSTPSLSAEAVGSEKPGTAASRTDRVEACRSGGATTLEGFRPLGRNAGAEGLAGGRGLGRESGTAHQHFMSGSTPRCADCPRPRTASCPPHGTPAVAKFKSTASPLAAPVWKKLKQWAQRLAVEVPEPGEL